MRNYARYLPLFIIVFLFAGVSCSRGGNTLPVADIVIEKAAGGKETFRVELALNRDDQAYGLMNRTEMADNAGMLFVFDDVAERAFWMKNTLIPLDMLFINPDGTVRHIHENAVPHDLTAIPSNGPVKAVLELNGGAASKYGLRPGDTVRYSEVFGNE